MARRKRKFKKNIVKFFLSIILVALVSYLSYQGYNYFLLSSLNINSLVNFFPTLIILINNSSGTS